MPKVVVGIFIKKENENSGLGSVRREVLLCQRLKNARYALKWEFPGGKIEPDESPKAGLVRELKEELGIDVRSSLHIYQQKNVFPDGGVFDVGYYLIEDFSGEIRNNAFEQMTWVSIERLNEFDILDGNRDVIDKLMEMYAEA
ncbi:MAG: (deoxy)nucleoside triphosphate pyrophosphohydrolase [Ignavibacteriae bacterium]|nr:(deoxy)nucleoside triphosphate pyrophosphohydrolase [Ignavibacteriota bacterium]